MPTKNINLVGQKFNRLSVIGLGKKTKRGGYLLRCRCDCGNERDVASANLKHGDCKSCGCLKAEQRTTHNMSHSSEWASWKNAKTRCSNTNNTQYADYGGRGIKFC